jgi:hypothetical protein
MDIGREIKTTVVTPEHPPIPTSPLPLEPEEHPEKTALMTAVTTSPAGGLGRCVMPGSRPSTTMG